jgi:hypothetical protein
MRLFSLRREGGLHGPVFNHRQCEDEGHTKYVDCILFVPPPPPRPQHQRIYKHFHFHFSRTNSNDIRKAPLDHTDIQKQISYKMLLLYYSQHQHTA